MSDLAREFQFEPALILPTPEKVRVLYSDILIFKSATMKIDLRTNEIRMSHERPAGRAAGLHNSLQIWSLQHKCNDCKIRCVNQDIEREFMTQRTNPRSTMSVSAILQTKSTDED